MLSHLAIGAALSPASRFTFRPEGTVAVLFRRLRQIFEGGRGKERKRRSSKKAFVRSLRTEELESRRVLAAYVPGEILVEYEPHAAPTLALAGEVGSMFCADLKERLLDDDSANSGKGALDLVSLPIGMSVEAALEALQNDPAI